MARLNVIEHGPADGRTVLAVHGVTGHGARWRVLSNELPQLRFLGVDLRGHGRSPWTPPWSLEQHVADLLAVMDAYELDRVPVVGHSFGGAIAVHLTRLAPERVERLVLLDPAIGLDADDMLAAAEDTRADESFPDLAAARASKAESWAGIAGELVDAELADHLVRSDDGRWRFRYSRAAVVTAWSEMARPAPTPPAGVPTLLVPATQADYVAPAWVELCRAELGGDLQVTVVDAGHLLFQERPARVAAVVGPFLAG